MHNIFASYEPDLHGVPLADVAIRRGSGDDAEATGRLAAEREGDAPERWTDIHARKLSNPDHCLVVAQAGDTMVGFGWVSYLRPGASAGRNAPDGWYLSGMVVAPDMRRRGVGRMLTEARIACVLEHSNEVLYVVSATNRASRDLHESLGFTEVTSDFVLPGVVFGNNDGILCRLGRDDAGADPGADVIDLAAWHAARHSAS